MPDEPTRGPIERSACHDAPMSVISGGEGTSYYRCGTCHRPCDPAPQPTAQAGEACPWCFGFGKLNADEKCVYCNGTGKVPAPPDIESDIEAPDTTEATSQELTTTEPHRSGEKLDCSYCGTKTRTVLGKCSKCRMPKPTPSAGEAHKMHGRLPDVWTCETCDYKTPDYNAACYHEDTGKVLSPQLPTPEHKKQLLRIVVDLAPGEAVEAITRLYNQRFEAAMEPQEVHLRHEDVPRMDEILATRQKVRDEARAIWYEGGTNHE